MKRTAQPLHGLGIDPFLYLGRDVCMRYLRAIRSLFGREESVSSDWVRSVVCVSALFAWIDPFGPGHNGAPLCGAGFISFPCPSDPIRTSPSCSITSNTARCTRESLSKTSLGTIGTCFTAREFAAIPYASMLLFSRRRRRALQSGHSRGDSTLGVHS